MLGGESSLREDDAAREDEDEDVVVVVRSSTRRAHAATLEGDDTLQPLGKRRRVDKPVETPVQQPMNTLVVNQVSGEEAEHETLAFNQEAMMDDGLSDDGMAACPEGLLESTPLPWFPLYRIDMVTRDVKQLTLRMRRIPCSAHYGTTLLSRALPFSQDSLEETSKSWCDWTTSTGMLSLPCCCMAHHLTQFFG